MSDEISKAEFREIGSQILGSLHPLRVSFDEGASPYEAKPDAYGPEARPEWVKLIALDKDNEWIETDFKDE